MLRICNYNVHDVILTYVKHRCLIYSDNFTPLCTATWYNQAWSLHRIPAVWETSQTPPAINALPTFSSSTNYSSYLEFSLLSKRYLQLTLANTWPPHTATLYFPLIPPPISLKRTSIPYVYPVPHPIHHHTFTDIKAKPPPLLRMWNDVSV